ncbi:hypothetical protein KM800_06550 [Clostridium tyrobutyricum]|uniref:hypothetical protein n=1 Tax=Clostridium tyrobutyricum TaxID=1519 RepID=UPI001C38F6B1|nr:hypothetical protein [Clostridium tyrobutyricum]MBV4418992.1 hypothetical protein [Clostridium tyrobutyricum]
MISIKTLDSYVTNEQYKDVIDYIIILSGLVGSFRSQKNIISISHFIYIGGIKYE